MKEISPECDYMVKGSKLIELDSLNSRLNRTVNAAYHALLEMSAWMGIPESKRMLQIKELMSNVTYCAENDLRHLDSTEEGQ